jgi:hypothetical protein
LELSYKTTGKIAFLAKLKLVSADNRRFIRPRPSCGTASFMTFAAAGSRLQRPRRDHRQLRLQLQGLFELNQGEAADGA